MFDLCDLGIRSGGVCLLSETDNVAGIIITIVFLHIYTYIKNDKLYE